MPLAATPQRKTITLLATSAAVAAAAALLTARGAAPATTTTSAPPVERCGDGAIASAGGMTLAVRPRSCEIHRGAGETHVAVEIQAPASDRKVREPIAMSLVVDRSGSMLGAPLDDAKAAALRAIDALEPRDAFSLVTYSTRAELVVPLAPATPEHKARARAVIERMRASGGTNISDGLETGADSLDAACVECPRSRLERIVLVSDGDPNEGVYDRDGLAALAARTAASGTSITTIGVGLDFNEGIMTDMAVAGRGNYYFVERAADLPTIVAQELGSLGDTVAVDARLEVAAAPGFDVVEAYGYRVDRQGDRTIVPIADLRAGETRKVVLRVRVTDAALGRRDLVDARLAWRPTGAHQERTLAARVAVALTEDPYAEQRTAIAAAEVQVQEATMAQAVEEATQAYERGDVAGAAAIVEQRYQAAAESAAAIGDEVFEKKLKTVKKRVDANFAKPAKAAGAKDNRALGYDLTR